MTCSLNKFILHAIILSCFLSADIGHNNVIYEGKAGDIPLRVFVQLPGVVPGLSDISVRVFADGVNKVTASRKNRIKIEKANRRRLMLLNLSREKTIYFLLRFG